MVEQLDIKSILKKFSEVNYPNHKIVIKELSKLATVTAKLDHLHSLKNEHYDKYQKVINSEPENELFFGNKAAILKDVFGVDKLITPLCIQEPVFNKFFKNEDQNPEYTYWFLKYMAQERFSSHVNSEKYKLNIELKFEEEFQNELEKIIAIEEKAFHLLKEEKIDFSNNTKNERGFLWTGNDKKFVDNKDYEGNSVEVLRVLKGYYEIKPTSSLYDWASKEVDAYYKHILLKPHLESILCKEGKENSVPVKTLALVTYVQQEIKEIKRLVHQKDVIAYGNNLGVSGNHFKNAFVKINSSNGSSGFNKDHYEEAIGLLSEKGRGYAIKEWDSIFN